MGDEICFYGDNMVDRFPRSFAARHPLFRAKHSETGIWWENSVYYLWWEYLRRHDGFRRVCQNKNKGSFKRLFDDFGNVHSVDFKTWWTADARGVTLFAEPPAPIRVVALSDQQALDLISAGRDDRTLIVAIPLDYRRRTITSSLAKILLENHSRKRGEKRVMSSKAKYPLHHAPDISALKTTLDCFDLKQQHPEMPLWQIAQRVGVSSRLTRSELDGTGGHVADKKASMTAGVSRKLKHALLLIESASQGVFPVR